MKYTEADLMSASTFPVLLYFLFGLLLTFYFVTSGGSVGSETF